MHYSKQVLCCAMALGTFLVAQQRPLSLDNISKELEEADSAIQKAIAAGSYQDIYRNAIKRGLKKEYGYGFEDFIEDLALTPDQIRLFYDAYTKALLALTDYDLFFVNNPEVKVSKEFVGKLQKVLGIRRLVEDLRRYAWYGENFKGDMRKLVDIESLIPLKTAYFPEITLPLEVRKERTLGILAGEDRPLAGMLVYMAQNRGKYGKLLSDYIKRYYVHATRIEYSSVIFLDELKYIADLQQAINGFKEQSNYQNLEKSLVEVSKYFNTPGTIEYNFFRTVCATGLEKGIFGVITGYFLGSDIAKERIDIFKDSTFKQENNKVIRVLVDTCYEALALYFSAVKDITTIPSEIYNLITFLNSLDKSCNFKSKHRETLINALSKARVGLVPNKKDVAIAPMVDEPIK